jgi:hypothetical protein
MKTWAGKLMAGKSGISVTVLLLCLGWLYLVGTAHSNPFAVVAITNENFGAGAIVDSFDSSDPKHSDWQTSQFYQGHNYGVYPSTDSMSPSGDTAGPWLNIFRKKSKIALFRFREPELLAPFCYKRRCDERIYKIIGMQATYYSYTSHESHRSYPVL